MNFFSKGIFILILISLSNFVFAAHQEIADDLRQELLSETVPFVFDPFELKSENYKLTWKDINIDGIRAKIQNQSIQWVRVDKLIVLPRGRLQLKAENIEAGIVSNAKFSQPLTINENKEGYAEIPIALLSGSENPITVKITRNGQTIEGNLILEYSNTNKNEKGKIILDSSCSKFNLSIQDNSIKDESWAYIGCRQVFNYGEGNQIPNFEIYVYWDNTHTDGIFINNSFEKADKKTPLWKFRLKYVQGGEKINFKINNNSQFTIYYNIPDHIHKGSIALGLGPYQYNRVQAGVPTVSTIAPFATFYFSYFINDSLRAVAFNGTQVGDNYYSDTGLYLLTEQIRSLDERFSFNLLLGAHVLALRSPLNKEKKIDFAFGIPQGMEFSFRDFGIRKYNLNLGLFLFPLINDKAYYNVWARWGTGSLFAEFNYISWIEKIHGSSIYAKSAGFCFGVPLLQFF